MWCEHICQTLKYSHVGNVLKYEILARKLHPRWMNHNCHQTVKQTYNVFSPRLRRPIIKYNKNRYLHLVRRKLWKTQSLIEFLRAWQQHWPVTIQTDVPNKLVQMAIWTFTLHPPGQSHQAVDVLNVCSHLETLDNFMQNELVCLSVRSLISQKKVENEI